ncbi:MAG TPA: site-specific integrase, partial [Methylomirabilota bacterium]|nr:site-specific integrase [Methylomirabilota bacterium]
ELGHLPLGSIERSHVTELLRAKRATYSRNSVRLIRAPLSSLLSDAADEGLIPVNPALGGRRSQRGHHLTPTDRLQRIRPMSLEQRDAFLRAAEGDPWAPLFELLAKTGARPGEAFALQVGDLDLEAGIARIERGWSLGAIVPTKTHHARRVDLSPRVARLLRVQRTEARTRALKEKWRGPLWLFSTEAGTPLDESKVRKRYKRLLRAAGLSGFRLYDLRHTYASLRLAGGAPLTYVAAQLGHSTPATTLRFYARWIPTEARTWVEQDRPERRPHAKTAAALRAAPARRRLSRGRDVETP